MNNEKEICVKFATWVQENYSQNKSIGGKEMLPKGKMRKDFTDEVYTIDEIFEEFKKQNP